MEVAYFAETRGFMRLAVNLKKYVKVREECLTGGVERGWRFTRSRPFAIIEISDARGS